MKKVVFIILLLAVLLLISGCSTEIQKEFQDKLKNLEIAEYTINEFSSISSSGGDKTSNEIRIIEKSELEKLQKELKNLNPIDSFSSEGRDCYFNDYKEIGYFVCFKSGSNKMTNYIKVKGSFYYRFNDVEFLFNFLRSDFIDSIYNLKECQKNSDCELVTHGICDPTGTYPPIYGVSCDSGCRTAISSKYAFVWEFVPYNEDKCIEGRCSQDSVNEKATPFCKNNKCDLVFVKS
ncbi:hypothetical protein CO154_00465 [Candidatus Pacearchaeota archaeon CG_4_9_14_3_um_filter_31_7]|nr:MAG: hypothetical protein COU55_02255 [Candidatus Pacearchaeota archaeon CG10_big_fil_rev_8_21_14_0_10_31_59]PIZ80259.1 MAG: hypothetical protein COX99_03020 [Candidatus Pacearchaeota archaeon CG_4_10_14_0_2_um_filter_31_10]PJA70882.1 MAG: hypothetical protein CO154_00465 [Candidatus Pacearchaeota archaeon CG_4_9_14_3_um_filter_31_7]